MVTQLGLSFDAVDTARACAAAELARLLPSLVPALQVCDVGVDARTRRVRLRVHAEDAVDDAAARRVAFWAARAGGRSSTFRSAAEEQLFSRAMESCQRVHRGIDVLRVFAAMRAEFPPDAGVPVLTPVSSNAPVLQLDVYGPGFDGVTYDPRVRVLFVPSPLAPAPGDEFVLQLDAPGWHRGAVRASATVVAVRSPEEATPGHPAGFRAAVRGSGGAHAVLVDCCPNPLAAERMRATQRYRVFGRVQVRDASGSGGVARDGYLRDLSMGGAFIRTERTGAPGERVQIDVALPNGASLCTGATVVHAGAGGMGVRFDAGGDAALAATITSLSGRARRVLVVDDDALSRAMLGDAFRADGWEALSAPDASVGLQMLTEELFALDLLVTDVRMAGMDGAEFVHAIRRLGGEHDLPIVVVTGMLDETLRQTLRRLGADAVIAKSLGAGAVLRGAEAAIAARRGAACDEASA